MLRGLFSIRRRLGGKDWSSVWPEHHEDPLYMRRKELIYFSHKYYYRAITLAEENSGLEQYFTEEKKEALRHDDFVPEQEMTLSAGGDLMPYAAINNSICEHLWDEIGDWFFDADLVTANLETPLVQSRKKSVVPEVMLSHMYFNADQEMFDVFSGSGKYKGYDLLSVANNHSLDQGAEGLQETLRFLQQKNISWCGARQAPEDAVPILEKNGIRIAFIGATFSLNAEQLPADKKWMIDHLPLNNPSPDLSRLVHQARKARELGADLLVAHLHMGCAYQPYPSLHSVKNIHRICRECGVDIVLGGHPHNPQPSEWLKITDPFSGKEKHCFIAYSLGDFVAYDIFKWCHLPMLIKFRIGKKGDDCRITGVKIKLLYTSATTEKGKITGLKFRDFNSALKEASEKGDAHEDKKELEELRLFAEKYLLHGNTGSLFEGYSDKGQ